MHLFEYWHLELSKYIFLLRKLIFTEAAGGFAPFQAKHVFRCISEWYKIILESCSHKFYVIELHFESHHFSTSFKKFLFYYILSI